MKLSNLKQSSHDYPFLPVEYSLPLPQFKPFKMILDDRPSMVFDYQDGRYTTLILNPKQIITARDGQVQVQSQDGTIETHDESPVTFLNRFYQEHRTPRLSNLPAFRGGLIGYFGYDFVRYAKDVRIKDADDKLNLADLELFNPDVIMTYDHQAHELILTKLVASKDLSAIQSKVLNELQTTGERVKATMAQADPKHVPLTLQAPFHYQFDQAQFQKRVAEAQRHIYLGDIFQLILSNPSITTAYGSLASVGESLYHNQSSPYHFYFHNRDFEATGASPETLIRKDNEKLFSYPLAGTRRRGHDQAEDDFFAHELLNSPKELAEHNMLVDLGRNDLGRVSQFGSVKVTALRHLLKFSNVMHMGSKIESLANPDETPVDIVSAVLPAGTLSGAPKISAMQIINKLENRKRGIYGGGIGFIDFDGDLDLCIGIRLAYKKGDQLVVHSGAGIVSDSDADQEFHEFNNKSRLMMNEIKKATTKTEA